MTPEKETPVKSPNTEAERPTRPRTAETKPPATGDTMIPYDPYAEVPPPKPPPVDESITMIPYDPYA